LVGWATACALTSWRRLGPVARFPALLLNELPFLAGYFLLASAALRWQKEISIRLEGSSSESRR